jgi:hypothetical protein
LRGGPQCAADAFDPTLYELGWQFNGLGVIRPSDLSRLVLDS